MKKFHSLLQRDFVKQIETVERLNKEHHLGIDAQAFIDADKSRPTWPHTDQCVVVVLAVHLHRRAMFDSTAQTIRGSWNALDEIVSPHKQNRRTPEVIREPRIMENFRILPGIEPFVGLRWETLNLFHHRKVSAKDVRSPKTSPGAGVLAVGIHHPELIKQLGTDEYPNLCLPGYTRTFDVGLEPNVLVLEYNRELRSANLILKPESYASPTLAVPEFFRA